MAKIVNVISFVVCLSLATACFDAPPIFLRPMFNCFSAKDVYGTYVAEFNPHDTIWVYSDSTFLHRVYDKNGVKVHDVTGRYSPFKDTFWVDPYSRFYRYVDFLDSNYVYNEADSTRFNPTGISNTLHFGLGYEGHPKNSLYLSPYMKLYWDESEIEWFYYRKIE